MVSSLFQESNSRNYAYVLLGDSTSCWTDLHNPSMELIFSGHVLLQHMQTFWWLEVLHSSFMIAYKEEHAVDPLLLYANFSGRLYWHHPLRFYHYRNVYHFQFWNLCRVGKGLGVYYFHRMTCNSCLGMKISSHRRSEKGMERWTAQSAAISSSHQVPQPEPYLVAIIRIQLAFRSLSTSCTPHSVLISFNWSDSSLLSVKILGLHLQSLHQPNCSMSPGDSSKRLSLSLCFRRLFYIILQSSDKVNNLFEVI